ncbi:MAG: DNA polymerase elongation subunit [Candidatus Aenigmatarchaeota archaeon]|nr:MAG: DNA polymerase elongation subunit [Candidatus Aenigmarchaeota archaeon]
MGRFSLTSGTEKWYNNIYLSQERNKVVAMKVQIQVLDVDYDMLNNRPIVRIFGKDRNGKTYCVCATDLLPYFYIKTTNPKRIEEELRSRFGGEIEKTEIVERYLPIGYSDKIELLKVTTRTPSKVPEIRDYIKDKVDDIYEADILFKYRYMVDRSITGMGWIEVEGNPLRTDTIRCATIEARSITPIENDENVPLRILALDIEVKTPQERIPSADKDPIIMIALAYSEPFRGRENDVLVAKSVPGDVISCTSEEEMLEKLKDIIESYDPDIITGYNINNFDMPYIIQRMQHLNLKRDLGRVVDKTVFCQTFGPQTKTNITGRVIVDSYRIVKKEYSFKNYTLNTVAKDLLGEEKEDVSYKEINGLWEDRNEIHRLISYARKDSILALKLITEKKPLDKYIALCRVSGVLLQDVLDGGESIRIENLLLSEFNKKGFVLPLKPGREEIIKRSKEREKEGIKGGLVLEPNPGLYADGCVMVMDFKSLYPSIIRTFNICPTTLLTRDLDVEYNESPAGARFVKSSVREGIIPRILSGLIDGRSTVKKRMYQEKDPEKRRLLDAKQYAFKIMANAFYGYCGYMKARTYNIHVANAITSYGRHLIQKTADKIRNEYGLEIIYGDTDSVMVKYPSKNLDEVYEVGTRIAKEITDSLPGVLELEFEKIFRSFLILAKKRYAGWAFEKHNGEWSDKIEMKGIETVRRDWCDLVTNTMNAVIDMIIKEGDVNRAISFVQEKIEQIRKREVPLKELSVTKSITKSLESYDGVLPHIEAAKKMRMRDPSNPPTRGDRISFVIVEGNQMLSKRAETIEYVKEKNLKTDTDYYINNQLLPPIERIFAVLGVSRDELLGKGRQTSLSDIMGNRRPERNHDLSIEMSPREVVVKNPTGFICSECNRDFRRVTLTGRCECGGEIYASGQGFIGKYVEI